jgi:selenocysteine lyase/cysteine desulfurase
MQHATSSALVVAGWHRMGYSYAHSDQWSMSGELERHIRSLHSVVGNAVTAGRYIVFGAGSTQLLNAAVNALSSDNSSTPARVVALSPYYPVRTS